MQSFALVDYDNMKDKARGDDSDASIFLAIQQLTESIHDLGLSTGLVKDELVLRLYGGWMDERGRYTGRAERLMRVSSRFPRRARGTRIRIQVALSSFIAADKVLFGTYRKQDGRAAQKMVDSMMCIDIRYLVEQTQCPTLVVSDDDDLIPALLQPDRHENLLLIRRRAHGMGLNDHHLLSCGIRIESI